MNLPSDGPRPVDGAKERPSLLCTIGSMLGLGLVLGFSSISAIPSLEQWGVPKDIAQNSPFAAFLLGAVFGLALRTSKGSRELLTMLAAPLVTGAVFWFFGVLAGALLLLFGAGEDVADYAPPCGFLLGIVLGGFPVVVVLFEGAVRRLTKGN